MTRVVADTNIIISSLFWGGHPHEVIRRGISGDYQLVTSSEILDEVIDRLRNKFQFPEEGIQQLIDMLLTHCHVVEPTSRFNVARDWKDNRVIECAFDGGGQIT